jgi:hypothetical protein
MAKYEIRIARNSEAPYKGKWDWRIYVGGKKHMVAGANMYKTAQEAAKIAELYLPLDDEWPYGIKTY